MLFAFVTACCIVAVLIISWLSTQGPQVTDFEVPLPLIANYTLRILSGESDMPEETPNDNGDSRRTNNASEPDHDDHQVCRRRHSLTQESQSSGPGACGAATTTAATTTATTSGDDASGSTDNEPISICFRLLNETQRVANVRPLQTVGEVKSIYFHQELNTNQLVRFIFRGRLLRDHETLKSCDVTDNTTVHCFITSPPPAPSANEPADSDQSVYASTRNVDISHLLVPMLTVALLSAWYLRVKCRRLFSPTSTILLVLLTLIYATGLASAACQQISTSSSSSSSHRTVRAAGH